MSVLGIDIGSDTIKVVEVAKARGGYRLLGYGIVPTPPNSVQDGDVRDPELVGEALRQLLKMHRFKANRTVSAVQGTKSTVVRIIELPRMARGELADTMTFEVERHIPFAASQIIMDYSVVDRPGEPADSANMEVLFAAVQEEVVELHVQALRKAKLKPKAIDVQPLALSRSLVEVPSPGRGVGETVAIVNIGATVTDLSIIRDGILHFPRTISLGGRAITQRLSEGLGISEREAERKKWELASVRPLPPGAAPAEPAAEEEPGQPAAPTFGFGAAAFQTDAGEESDTGFGGTGTGGFTFEDTADVEVNTDDDDKPRQTIDLDDLDADGPTFNFGFEEDDKGTKFSLTPDEPEDRRKDAPVPDEEPVFSFGDDDEPEVAEEPALQVGDTDAAQSDETPAEAGFDFDFGAEEPTAETGETETVTSDTVAFDFNLGEDEDDASSAAAPAPASGTTDVGSSFDLGDLATSDEGIDFDLGELGDEGDEGGAKTFTLADLGLTSETPVAAVDLEGDEAHQVRQVVEPVAREIAGEIARSLDYYRSRTEGAVVDRVVLVGGTARLEGMAELLEQELGLPVDKGDPLATLTVGNPRLTDEDLRRDAPLLAVAVGLALRELM